LAAFVSSSRLKWDEASQGDRGFSDGVDGRALIIGYEKVQGKHTGILTVSIVDMSSRIKVVMF